ncbi:MAG: hypothetical protein K9K67_05910 [Bacteriovoracaceae bacterium]|nr:hypothetical protein [Bacteriovoracaceae bacterium]
MANKNNLCADIQVKKQGRKKVFKNIKFNLPEKEITIADTLMSEFSDLGFSTEEKNKLSRQHREYFCSFKSLKESEIKKMRTALVKDLLCLEDESLVICASEGGALICLAAIFSGELPKNVDWRFELEDLALPLFPKELIKNCSAAQSFEITFKYHEKGFIKPFPSLRKAPGYMGFEDEFDISDFREIDPRKSAA